MRCFRSITVNVLKISNSILYDMKNLYIILVTNDRREKLVDYEESCTNYLCFKDMPSSLAV